VRGDHTNGVSLVDRKVHERAFKGVIHLLICGEMLQLVLHCLERNEVGPQVDSLPRLERGRRGEVSVLGGADEAGLRGAQGLEP